MPEGRKPPHEGTAPTTLWGVTRLATQTLGVEPANVRRILTNTFLSSKRSKARGLELLTDETPKGRDAVGRPGGAQGMSEERHAQLRDGRRHRRVGGLDPRSADRRRRDGVRRDPVRPLAGGDQGGLSPPAGWLFSNTPFTFEDDQFFVARVSKGDQQRMARCSPALQECVLLERP